MWNWMFPTAKNAQESFQSARVMVSQAGTRSDCVWTSETRNGAKKAAGEQGGIWALPPRHLPVSWGSPRDLVGIVTANSPWGNRKRGLDMKMDKPSLWHFVWFLDWDDRDHLLRTPYVSGSWLWWTCLREHLARSGRLWVITAWDWC